MASSSTTTLTAKECDDLQKNIEITQLSIGNFYAIRNFEAVNQREILIKAYRKKLEDNKCPEKIGGLRAEAIGGIMDVYGAMDKKRIEAESKYREKQKIFFGGVIFMGAVLIVTMFGKKK